LHAKYQADYLTIFEALSRAQQQLVHIRLQLLTKLTNFRILKTVPLYLVKSGFMFYHISAPNISLPLLSPRNFSFTSLSVMIFGGGWLAQVNQVLSLALPPGNLNLNTTVEKLSRYPIFCVVGLTLKARNP
jgi:hypothetical protein